MSDQRVHKLPEGTSTWPLTQCGLSIWSACYIEHLDDILLYSRSWGEVTCDPCRGGKR
jgi:hypothetical protein